MSPLQSSLALVLLGGCVHSGVHQAKLLELSHLRRESIDRQQVLLGRVGTLERQVEEQARRLKTEGDDRARLAKLLDDTTALVGELQARLQRGGQDLAALGDEGAFGESLRQAQARLEELRQQKAEAEASARTFHGLKERLRGMIDAGQLEVKVKDGRALITMSDDALFDAGRAQLRPEGQATLGRVAEVLRGIEDRHFLIGGHSDDLPAPAARFASTWELSAARAVEVTKVLVNEGVRPQALAATGYGQFEPLYPNDSPEHRALNRRIEIKVQVSP